MPGVSLSGLLAAAVVSAAVALGVEWLAKPRLEVRKERILRRWHAKDEVWRTLDRILFAAAIMKNTRSQPEDVQAADTEILPATADLEETFREVMLFTSGRDIDLVSSLVGMIRGAWQSDRTCRQRGELLFACMPVVMDVLGGPAQKPLHWLRWRYRARRAREARAFFDSDPWPVSVTGLTRLDSRDSRLILRGQRPGLRCREPLGEAIRWLTGSRQ